MKDVTTMRVFLDNAPGTEQAFHSVSLEPPLISVTLGAESGNLAAIRSARRFAVNVLASNQE